MTGIDDAALTVLGVLAWLDAHQVDVKKDADELVAVYAKIRQLFVSQSAEHRLDAAVAAAIEAGEAAADAAEIAKLAKDQPPV